MTPGPTSCIRSLSEETMVTSPPASTASLRIGGDQVVGLETLLLDAGQVEGAHRLADQRELRHQVLRRRGAVRLVLVVELVAEGGRGMVEDDGEMRRRDADRRVARFLDQLPQHVAETGDGADRHAVGLARQRRQRVVGAEDVGRAVDEEEMIAFFHVCCLSRRAKRVHRACPAGVRFTPSPARHRALRQGP